jgi:prefoldin subunit 5
VDDRAQTRLEMLRKEFEIGQKQLSEVESQRAQLTETMLRISGAIQVLEELVGERPESDPVSNGGASSASEPAGRL